jgi:hypothetical protein
MPDRVEATILAILQATGRFCKERRLPFGEQANTRGAPHPSRREEERSELKRAFCSSLSAS